MKNQYVGDIGDYGKYGLLRFLAVKGIRIGVNWYLTENDETEDGKFTQYLSDQREDGDRRYDEALFQTLRAIVKKGKNNKSVQDIEENDIIPNAVFFHETLKATNRQERKGWHERALKALLAENVDLVFADPDNGTLSEKEKATRRNGEKYALLEELRDYYDNGKDVVYYCHKARRNEQSWRDKKAEFNDDGHQAKIVVLTFHRGTQRSYIFAVHPEHSSQYDAMLEEFLQGAWGSVATDKKKPPFSREA